ncbi:MAG: hypothetical protein RR491_09645, partial [Lachnospiraceae bacterium]
MKNLLYKTVGIVLGVGIALFLCSCTQKENVDIKTPDQIKRELADLKNEDKVSEKETTQPKEEPKEEP